MKAIFCLIIGTLTILFHSCSENKTSNNYTIDIITKEIVCEYHYETEDFPYRNLKTVKGLITHMQDLQNDSYFSYYRTLPDSAFIGIIEPARSLEPDDITNVEDRHANVKGDESKGMSVLYIDSSKRTETVARDSVYIQFQGDSIIVNKSFERLLIQYKSKDKKSLQYNIWAQKYNAMNYYVKVNTPDIFVSYDDIDAIYIIMEENRNGLRSFPFSKIVYGCLYNSSKPNSTIFDKPLKSLLIKAGFKPSI